MSLKIEPINEKISLLVLTKFIKPYNGDRETLPAFLTNCDNAISLAAPEQQQILCKYIISQLEGKAQTACSLKIFDKWSELKVFLKTTFGEKKHSSHLLIELQNCRQTATESVTKFSLRVESCLTRLLAEIQYSCRDEEQLIGRIAAMEDLALNTFIMGLNLNISTIVRCRNPNNLNEAICLAVEEEKLFNLNRLSQRTIKSCSICNKQGHNSSECYRKKPRSDLPPIHRSYHVPNPNFKAFPARQFTTNYNNNQLCAYCKNLGHTINECRKRQYNQNRRTQVNITNNSQPDSAVRSQHIPASSHAPNSATRIHCCEMNSDNNYFVEDGNDLNEN
jgi:hypothetical protein